MSASDDFFIGWDSRVAPRLARFALGVAIIFLVVLAAIAMALGRAVDTGAGDIVGETSISGILETTPVPLLRAPPDARHPLGHMVMLAGDGKNGIGALATTLAGQAVEARGLLVRRGDLDMLVVATASDVRPSAVKLDGAGGPVRLGRWRMSGEICDGKCAAGIMRPGSGLAHKACASLCVSGGVPAVFVSTAPVEGASFLLLADMNGGPPPAVMNDVIAVPVTLEGDIERRADMLVFRVDWSRMRSR